jgi:dipeptidyl aminopeptidase/acylaminoacyl peptidase
MNGNAVDVSKFSELKKINFLGENISSPSINSLVWSPDGNKLASGSSNKIITIWDPITGSKIKTLLGHTDYVTSVAWSPNGSFLASGSNDKTIKIWNVKTGINLRTLTGHTNQVLSIAWNSNGSSLVSGSLDRSVKIWNITTGVIIKNCTGHTLGVFSVAWSPDGKEIASGSNDATVKVWNAMTGKLLLSLADYHTAAVTSVAWNPNGSLLASSSQDTTTRIWNLTNQNNPNIMTFNGSGDINSLSWSPDGRKITSVSDSGSLEIWDIVTGVKLKTLMVSQCCVSSVTWSPDGKEIASGSGVGVIQIWGENTSITFPNVHLNSLTADNKNITINDNIDLIVTLTNNGTANGLNNKLDFYDGTTYLATKYMDVIHGGVNITSYLWQTTDITRLGPHHLRVIFRTEEKNITVVVRGKPNIFIKNLNVEKSNIIVGEQANITVILANNGTADGLYIIVNLYDGNNSLITRSINISYNGTITIIYPWTTNNFTYIGTHKFRAVVEINEKNATISVNGKPNVYLMDMIVDRINITKGKNVIITTFIRNNGTADAINVNLNYYQDNTLMTTKRVNITKGQTITSTLTWNTENTTIGNHKLKVIVDNSVKEKIVNVYGKNNSIKLANLPNTFLIILIIILTIIIIIFICRYRYIKK